MIVTKINIIEKLQKEKMKLYEKYAIETLGLFGSYAKEEAKEESDIDIFFQMEEGKSLTFSQLLDFEQDLSNFFSKKIDLVNLKNINPIVYYTAKKNFIYV